MIGTTQTNSQNIARRVSNLSVLILTTLVATLTGCTPPAMSAGVSVDQQPTALTATATSVVLPSPTPLGFPSETATTVFTETPVSIPTSTNITFTFNATADARVDEAEPDENFGSRDTLRTDGAGDPQVESFLRFDVTAITGPVANARLLVYAAGNDSDNGPALYLTEVGWEESAITWNTRPARQGGAIDNEDRISSQSWVEYDVTSQVSGNGSISFALAADSSDGIDFASRESAYPPQLVITTGEKAAVVSTPTPTVGAAVLVGAGDISSCDIEDDELTAQLLDAIPGTVFTTGDNVYSSGTYSEFLDCYDPTWGRHKDRTKPVPGNHDYATAGAAGYFAYFGNVPSYYAYDLGSWRIYALNSQIGVSEGGEQVQWLREDLAANPRQCVLAYWHHPRWSSGSLHGSNPDLQTLWQIFYEEGAELVLNGHEHNYERFVPMDAVGQPDPQGMREIVVGTGGRNHYSFDTPLPTSEVRDSSTFGVLKLVLHDTGYDWQFIPVAGSTFTDSGSATCR
jgi:acid phosphatase type 7